ncbi:MAG TPA: hypothetical protein VFU11_03430 [Solirubrobacterales bacterium]|nr:hypothetical protein [Solirubrobacterales bacterium]
MRLRAIPFLCLAAIVAAVLVPAASAAGEEETVVFPTFSLQGTHGYEGQVLGTTKSVFKHGGVYLFVTSRKAAVIYIAPANVTATSIEADLGPVGRISVVFEPEGEPKTIRSSCDEGASIQVQPGSWVGTVDLTGEEGFTHAEASRVKSTASPFLHLVCGGVGIGETTGKGIRGARLVARAAMRKDSRFLQVNQNWPGGPVRVEASTVEKHHSLIVSREVVYRYRGSAFDFDPELRLAVLDPPSPFSGHATYSRNAKPRNQWTGNLLLDFPGRADVPMTGSRFNAALWHARRTEEK